MLLFEITSMEPLEPHEGARYCALAWDGDSYILPDLGGSRVLRHCPRLEFVAQHETARSYNGICHDPVEGCYWAYSIQNNDTVYKLTDTFREVDRLRFCGYDSCDGLIRSIAYDRAGDCLILTYASRVVTLDKHTLCQRAAYCGCCGQTYLGCIRSCGYDWAITRQNGVQLLTVTSGGRLLIHACLPCGYQALAMLEACTAGGPVIHILARKESAYYFLLKGVLVDCRSRDIPAAVCCCGERHTGKPSRCHHSHAPVWDDMHCAEHHKHHHDHKHHHHHHDHHHPSPIPIPGGLDTDNSCSSLMMSIALEQTAISHILNAEGEKIQKVVAVSDRPADFLDVNQSVLELVTKLTHLEQVLYSKLETTCETLHQSREENG